MYDVCMYVCHHHDYTPLTGCIPFGGAACIYMCVCMYIYVCMHACSHFTHVGPSFGGAEKQRTMMMMMMLLLLMMMMMLLLMMMQVCWILKSPPLEP